MTAAVPPAAVLGNDWRSLSPPRPDDFRPTVPVTVVIPYYEAPEALALTVAALERQTYPRRLFEVVIVDDGSATPLQAPESSPLTIRVLRQEGLGFGLSRARNLGARAAEHPIVVFLDCDMLPEAGWLSAHARWHHIASDLLTLGFRAHARTDGIEAATIRSYPASLGELLGSRVIDRPEWIEFHMARTDELTSSADDLFRVVTGGNLGVSRSFFEEVGGFDESFDRWGMEDTEFGYRGYTLGGPLVPVREAFCWHQGGRAAPDATKSEMLGLQRARVSHLIAHPDFRTQTSGRSFAVPRFVVTVDPAEQRADIVAGTVEEVLADPVHDLVVWVGLDRDHPGYEWLRQAFDPDSRVFVDPPGDALGRFPHSPFHITLPAGMACKPGIVEWLHELLGASASATGRLADGSPVSITRAWALHRSRRTGRDIADLGVVVGIDTAALVLRSGDRRPKPMATRRRFGSRATRVLRELAGVRNPRQAWAFCRWITGAIRFRLAGGLRRGRSRFMPPGKSAPAGSTDGRAQTPAPTRADPIPDHGGVLQADYPLGVEIEVVGPKARAVFAASSRVRATSATETRRVVSADVTLADTVGSGRRVRSAGATPIVGLAESAPRMAVRALDPEQINPIGWVREVGDTTGALGPVGLLPPDQRVDTVVRVGDPETLSGLHHLEDTAGFHADTLGRAATLASVAATGAVVRVVDPDAQLEACLGTELHEAMTDQRIPGADPALRESISIRMRRAALREHSLRARARQVAHEAGVPNDAGLPGVSIILPTKRPALLRRVLQTVTSQTYPRLELILALHGDGFPREVDNTGLHLPIKVVRAPSETVFGDLLNLATAAAAGELVTKMDDDDRYGVEHVWDLVLAREFSKADLVAKGAEFVHLVDSGTTIHRDVGGGEDYPDNYMVAGGAMLLARADLLEVGGWRQVPAAVDQALVTDLTNRGGRVYRTHGHGYVLARHGEGHTWDAPDSYFLRQAEESRPGCDLAFAGVE